MSDIIMKPNGGSEDRHPYVQLKHEGHDDVRLVLDELDRKNKWMENVALLPWATPHRLVGFVHPKAKPGKESFVLHAAFVYVAQLAVQQVSETQLRAVPGPRIALPYDLISAVDIEVHACPTILWAREQADEFKSYLTQLLRQQLFPSMGVTVAQPGDVPPPPKA